MGSMDFAALRREIKNSARGAFDATRKKHPDETFYAFALFSDDSAMTVCPAAITEEAYEKCITQAQADEELLASLTALHVGFADYCASYYRWGMCEGVYEYGHECFSKAIFAKLNALEVPENEFIEFKGQLFGTMALALRDLDADGYFGAQQERERITLLCGVTDSECAAWLAVETAHRLNPPYVFQAFWSNWSRDATFVEGYEQADEDPVHAEFVRYVEENWESA